MNILATQDKEPETKARIAAPWAQMVSDTSWLSHSWFRSGIMALALVVTASTIATTKRPGSLAAPAVPRPEPKSQLARVPSSMAFPSYDRTSDVGDIIDDYPAYLRFVVEASGNSKSGQQLANDYEKLVKVNRRGAAIFLKTLRSEMVHKLQLMNLTPRRVTSSDSRIREWVQKFLPEWNREMEEHLFRALARNKEKGD